MSFDDVTFKTAQALYARAEDAIKRYERITLSVLTPAINQLRYAGHHLCEAGVSDDGEVQKQLLYKVCQHCERAYYDALECTLSELLGFFARFYQAGYSEQSLSRHIPEFPSWKTQLRESQSLLLTTRRLKVLSDDEEQRLEEAVQYLIEKNMLLRDVVTLLEDEKVNEEKLIAKQECEARRIEAEIESQRENRRYWHSMALAYASIIVGVASLIIAIVSVM